MNGPLLSQEEMEALREGLRRPATAAPEALELASLERSLRRTLDGLGRELERSAESTQALVDRAIGATSLAKVEPLELQGPQTVRAELRECAYVLEIQSREGNLVGLAGINAPLAFAVVERAFGGRGVADDAEGPTPPLPLRQRLTPIEREIVHPLLSDVVGQVAGAIGNPELVLERLPTTMTPDLPPDVESVLVWRLRAELPEASGTVVVALGPDALPAASPKAPSPHGYAPWIGSHLGRSPVEIHSDLGKVSLTLGELLALRPGDVLRLEQGNNDAIALFVAGVPKFLGRPVESHGSFGIHIDKELR